MKTALVNLLSRTWLLALALVGVATYFTHTGKLEVEWLAVTMPLVIGFWFGSKGQSANGQ